MNEMTPALLNPLPSCTVARGSVLAVQRSGNQIAFPVTRYRTIFN